MGTNTVERGQKSVLLGSREEPFPVESDVWVIPHRCRGRVCEVINSRYVRVRLDVGGTFRIHVGNLWSAR